MEDHDIASANAQAGELQKSNPRAIAAWYDQHQQRVVVELGSGLKISFAPGDRRELRGALPDDLTEIEISPSGFGLHFSKIDADLYVPTLLKEISSVRDS